MYNFISYFLIDTCIVKLKNLNWIKYYFFLKFQNELFN